jgi:putative heme-binding domain-containing protein
MSPALLLLAAAAVAAPVADLAVPPGFAARLFADNALAPDIYTMTIDEDGRVLVAGRGYVHVLVDEDNDGVADHAIDLIDGLKDGPMGLFAEGDSLFVVVDGGLKRYRGYDGKSKLKQPPETLLALKTTGEHDAHAVRRGPDGWLYLLCGNMAGVKKETITSSRSPVKEPVAGTLVRISPDGKEVEVVADGFRNAYGFDFNTDGEPFTYDSDNERCVGLPWYEPCRFYHVVPGGNYGWRSPQLGQFWRKPPYFVDCVPPVCYLGRGSPTGVACYRHTHFPEKYRGGFFLADWTFGRIHFVPLTAKHSTYEGKPEVFAEAVGTSGFAPTALAVHPKTGELFVSIGGRGTRGGVYRIAHDKSPPGKPLEMAKRSLDWDRDAAKQWLADCTSADARVRRAMLERMLRAREKFDWSPKLTDVVKPNLSHPDPLVRIAAARAAGPLVVPLGSEFTAQARLMLALMDVAEQPAEAAKTALAVLNDRAATNDLKLQAIRIIQLAHGDLTDTKWRGTVFEGYTFRNADELRLFGVVDEACLKLLRTESAELEIEVFRTLAAMCSSSPEAFRRAVRLLHPASDIRDDLRYLIVLACLAYKGSEAERLDIADALIELDRKAAKQKLPRDTFWPLRVSEFAGNLGVRHPQLAEDVLLHSRFGRPEHLLLVKPLGIDPDRAFVYFSIEAKLGKDYAWTPGQIELLAHTPNPRRVATLRRLALWNRAELRDAILRVLPPTDGDQPKFVIGLQSLDPEVVRVSAVALEMLPASEGPTELAAGVKALRRLAPEDKAARAAVVALLQKRTEQRIGDDVRAWAEWVAKNHPETAKLLAANDGFDAAAWKKREAGIAWETGDATRGRAAFVKASCAACHDGGRALGPPLLGVTKRFGRDDLLASILQPGKDVSARYRPVRVTTTEEKTYIGMLVYEAQDGIILQTNADTAVRVAGEKIASKRPVDASFMPAGLLDKLTDAEVADLFAYLKTLEEHPK